MFAFTIMNRKGKDLRGRFKKGLLKTIPCSHFPTCEEACHRAIPYLVNHCSLNQSHLLDNNGVRVANWVVVVLHWISLISASNYMSIHSLEA
jgi:hypothetical protein